MNDLILQVNIPFCVRRCAYCNQRPCRYDPDTAAAYAKALLREIAAVAPDAADYTVRAVSLEGGSPALLAPSDLQAILRAIRREFHLAADAQISLQTMPGDYSRALMEKMRDNGVNFWVIGLETTELREHELLRRPYRFDALTMVDAAIRAFQPRSLSFDLLYGIPRQTEKSWLHTLETALAYKPEHLTLYPLRVLGGTALHAECLAGNVTPVAEEDAAALLQQAEARLSALGYRAYTRFDYCMPGEENRFRLGQLEGIEQLGLGYQALTVMDGYTYTNGHSLEEYLAHSDDMTILANNVTALTGAAREAYDRTRGDMRPHL